MINIVICDDDTNVLSSIAKMVESAVITLDFDAEIKCVTTNQGEVYNLAKEHMLDVLLLDVDFNTKGKNGIDFALQLRDINKDFKLIFVTSHFEYAFMSFKCKTFDYIMKPIDIDKMISVFKRLKADISNRELGLLKISKDNMLRTSDILFIERNKSKATVHTCNSVFETPYSLSTLEHKLPASFIRVHRSYIVNRDQIERINKDKKTVYFKNNESCPLGQLNINL